MANINFTITGGVSGLQVTNIRGGYRYREDRDQGSPIGKLFGIAFGLIWVAAGIGMLFLPESAMPGASFYLKAAIGVVLAGLGWFIVSAIRRNLINVLEVDIAAHKLRHFMIDANNREHRRREIDFADVTGVFTETLGDSDVQTIQRVNLVVRYTGRPGRLVVLASHNKDIEIVRDLIATQVLHEEAAPAVNSPQALFGRAKWEVRQRTRT